MFCKYNHKVDTLQSLKSQGQGNLRKMNKKLTCKGCVTIYANYFSYFTEKFTIKEVNFVMKNIKFREDNEYSEFDQIFKLLSEIRYNFDDYTVDEDVTATCYPSFLENTDCFNEIHLNKLLFEYYQNDEEIKFDCIMLEKFRNQNKKIYNYISKEKSYEEHISESESEGTDYENGEYDNYSFMIY
jgi:hypothetical protein